MSERRYFNWAGECWAIDLEKLGAKNKTDDVFVIWRPVLGQCAFVDFDEIKNLRMYDDPKPVLDQIEGES